MWFPIIDSTSRSYIGISNMHGNKSGILTEETPISSPKTISVYQLSLRNLYAQ